MISCLIWPCHILSYLILSYLLSYFHFTITYVSSYYLSHSLFLPFFHSFPYLLSILLTHLILSLLQSRGFVGRNEMYRKFQGDCLPGGYDHFNWVIFDEVHAIDGEDGDALQRLIRAMSCKFLALSATVGNANELRGWLERVRGDQLLGMPTHHKSKQNKATHNYRHVFPMAFSMHFLSALNLSFHPSFYDFGRRGVHRCFTGRAADHTSYPV